MTVTTRVSVCAAVLFVSMILTVPASGQVARVFLSNNGNDLNDCLSAGMPCLSLAGAVAKVPVNGEIIILTSGGYGGATITKSLTVNAPSGITAFVARTITVTIGASDKVVLRGLSMNGVIFGDANGISMTAGGTLIVENSLIGGFTRGISQTGLGSTLVVVNSEFRNNIDGLVSGSFGGGLVHLLVENSRFVDNEGGLTVEDTSHAVVRNSVASGNIVGFGAISNLGSSNSGQYLLVDTCVVSNNMFGLIANGTSGQNNPTILVQNSTITGNGTAITAMNGGLIKSFLNNRVIKNDDGETFSSSVPLS